ncbi:hypothetical protein L0222_03360 [bacterium]|nr:hypothetical protein [bacterium]
MLKAIFLLLLSVPIQLYADDLSKRQTSRHLTLERRITYQERIDRIYKEHRLSASTNSFTKPSRPAVNSSNQLREKVEDYLRKSSALDYYWKKPITAEQLQAEITRIVKYTQNRETLLQLFEALENDPSVIAECLARQLLADRLIRNWYSFDGGLHQEIRKEAERNLKIHRGVDSMRSMSGEYRKMTLVRADRVRPEWAAQNNMIVPSGDWNRDTGAWYDPATDTWTPIPR